MNKKPNKDIINNEINNLENVVVLDEVKELTENDKLLEISKNNVIIETQKTKQLELLNNNVELINSDNNELKNLLINAPIDNEDNKDITKIAYSIYNSCINIDGVFVPENFKIFKNLMKITKDAESEAESQLNFLKKFYKRYKYYVITTFLFIIALIFTTLYLHISSNNLITKNIETNNNYNVIIKELKNTIETLKTQNKTLNNKINNKISNDEYYKICISSIGTSLMLFIGFYIFKYFKK